MPTLYNGNISQTIWRTANDNTKRSYSYQYDDLNRIARANSLKGNTLMSGDSFSVWGINYDKNGNIGRITRNGRPGGGTTQKIDELYYTYSNNKLEKVREAITTVHKNEGFADGTNTNDDYVYDVNGNMTVDRNKGITNIAYNHLNLPTSIAINDQLRSNTGNISYIYDATGVKQKKMVFGGSSLTVEYAGNYVYENGQLQFYNTSEGYVEPNGNSSYDYIYQYTDHLGNIRLSYSDKNKDGKIDILRNDIDVDGDGDNSHEIREVKDYYPFGMTFNYGSNNPNSAIAGRKHAYQTFQGQEQTKDLGLNIYGWKYRISDPSIGRFWQIDPLAENFVNNSTYAFSENRVIDGWELEGRERVDMHTQDPNLQDLSPEEKQAYEQGLKDGAATGVAIVTLFTPGPDELLLGSLLTKLGRLFSGAKKVQKAASTAEKVSDKVIDAKKLEERAAKLNKVDRSGKDFTQAGKEVVKDQNKLKNAGKTKCENCGVETVAAKKSQKGVTPPKNETQVDHIIPKSKGGRGNPDNGQVLCRGCNREKSNKLPNG